MYTKKTLIVYTTLSSPAYRYLINNRNVKMTSTLFPVAIVVSSKILSFDKALPQLCPLSMISSKGFIFLNLTYMSVSSRVLCKAAFDDAVPNFQ